jgi:hypothetical protein
MKCAQLIAPLVIVACTIAPAAAAAGGQWTCYVAGSLAGQLTLDPASYSFTKSGLGQADLGSYTSHPALLAHDPAYGPGPAVNGDAGYLRITSGPLNELGVDLGFYNGSARPASLVFSRGPGKGMHCVPA